MTKKMLTIGEILVEIMAVTPGVGFREPISLVGPFPSGAPAIFIDQVARLGHRCAMIACVGDDDFGRLNIDRLQADGVEISGIVVDPDPVRVAPSCAIAPTASAILSSTSTIAPMAA